MTITYGSVCSGIEAASVAWSPLGWQCRFVSEIEKFPCAVLKHHFPSVPNFGDMTKFLEWPDDQIDVLVGGTPCFEGSTPIICRRGIIPISEVVVGDEVFTHQNRWQLVLATGSKHAETITLKGQGQSTGIVTTCDHPFYSRSSKRVWVGRKNGSRAVQWTEPSWTRASDMLGLRWASPACWPVSEAPTIETKGNEHKPPTMTADLAWVIGRWLGDGWCRISPRRGLVLICCGKHEIGVVEERLRKAEVIFSRSEERTTYRFQVSNSAFARWLHIQFGAKAIAKTMPTWVFGWEHRKALLEGYLSADGCVVSNGARLTTISRNLALATVLLAHSLGQSASRRLVQPSRPECIIEGRVVTENPFWQVSIYDSARSSVELAGHRWGLVRSVEPGRTTEVFNLEVAGDNSYVADGVIVHNCQSFSVAGLRRGLADPRGNLALVYLGILDKYRPRWCIWENVPGVLSSSGGRDFGAFLGALGQLGYGFAYRVLDAQHFGVPQRRRRVFVVGHLGDWRRAAAVLFERESLSRYPTEGRKDGEVASPALDGCAEARTVALRGREGGATAELGGTVATALRASQGGGDKPYILADRVRRLSPVECERLQGFPDDWTKVTAATKDGPRYKAIGNSMAVPVMQWIGEGIAAVSSLSP